MEHYIGIAVVQATAEKKDDQEGRRVRGLSGDGVDGCWVEDREFLHYFRPMSFMPFGLAIESLRRGCCIYRPSWPHGTYLHLQAGDGETQPHCYVSRSISGKTKRFERSWSPSSEDMLAVDWRVGTNRVI